MKQRAFVFAVIVCMWWSVQAQPILEVHDEIIEHNFMPNELTYYIDSTNSLSFWQISSNSFSNRFKKHSSYQNKDFKKRKCKTPSDHG